MKQIIAIGGGGFGRQIKDLKIEKYIVSQSKNKNPSICFIPTATGDDQQNSNFLDAAEKLIMAYEMDMDKNIDYLYFAAGSAVNGKDYDLSLEYYVKLKNMGYTGIVDEYFVTNNETGLEEKVSQTEYDLLKIFYRLLQT